MIKKNLILVVSLSLSFFTMAVDLEVHDVKVQQLSSLVQSLTGDKIIHIGKMPSSKLSMVIKDAKKKELLELFHETLMGVNLAIVKDDSYYKIVSSHKVSKYSPPVVESLESSIGVVSYVAKINKHTSADLISAITPLLGGGGKVIYQKSTSSIIITDSVKNIKNLVSLIGIIEDSYQPSHVKTINVDYADVSKISEKISKLGIKDLKIIADMDNNQLFLHGSKADISEASKVANEMNQMKNKVVIEVLIAEISQTGASSNGVQMGLGSDYGIGVSAWDNTDTVSLASIITGISTGEMPTLKEGGSFGFGSKNSSGVNFGVIAQAIKRNGESNILSTPIINTIDGKEAEFIVGKNVPFVTRMDKGDNPFQSVVREDVGLKLKVKPVVMSDGRIRLSVEQEISSISGATKLDDIITDKRFLKTETISDNGSLVVLGGLMDKSDSDKVDKIPLLGDLPYIGNLFSFENEDRDKRKLLIFMKPTVVTNKTPESTVKAVIENQKNLYNVDVDVENFDGYSYFSTTGK